MHTLSSPVRLACRLGLVALVAWGFTAAGTKAAPAPFVQTRERPGEIRMEEVPWKQVIRWIMEQTGIQLIATELPPGKFTFVSPKGVPATVAQVMDSITGTLRRDHGFLLIRRERNLLLVRDERLDASH
jgi:hypothetical protein